MLVLVFTWIWIKELLKVTSFSKQREHYDNILLSIKPLIGYVWSPFALSSRDIIDLKESWTPTKKKLSPWSNSIAKW